MYKEQAIEIMKDVKVELEGSLGIKDQAMKDWKDFKNMLIQISDFIEELQKGYTGELVIMPMLIRLDKEIIDLNKGIRILEADKK